MKPVVYSHDTESDIFAAVRFYEARQEGLGARFLLTLEKTILKIARQPEIYAFCEKPVRSCRVPKFPYRVLYVDESAAILVVALAHLSRAPGWWKHRIRH